MVQCDVPYHMLGEACMKEMTKSYIGGCVTTLGIGDTHG